MNITIDFSNVERADDGNTTYFGGTAKVNGETLQIHGNDRGDGLYSIVVDKVEHLLNRALSEEENNKHVSELSG